jgi:hypothetical protein
LAPAECAGDIKEIASTPIDRKQNKKQGYGYFIHQQRDSVSVRRVGENTLWLS